MGLNFKSNKTVSATTCIVGSLCYFSQAPLEFLADAVSDIQRILRLFRQTRRSSFV